MISKTPFQPSRLQQQPRRPVNRQQQQSSGSGEFQPLRAKQAGEAPREKSLTPKPEAPG